VATDIRQMVENLRGFHDLRGRVILSVGSGGGQFLDLYREAGKILAVDSDPVALLQLEAAVSARGLQDLVELVQGDFFEVARRAEVVVFEFCLHEMPDAARALERARSLAPDVLVFDHAPGSRWAHHTVEEDKVLRSTQAMEGFDHPSTASSASGTTPSCATRWPPRGPSPSSALPPSRTSGTS
jgi:hypothetical protein